MSLPSQIDPEARKQASGILTQILHEDPSYWPYGLSVDQFDGGLYLLSKKASNDYFGFVGWQERDEGHRKVGYYAIGVLPEFRRRGFAKAAVQELLSEKSAGVDEVRAMVMTHNNPSQQLARGIPGVHLTLCEKTAALSTGQRQAIGAALGALGSTAFFDQAADPNRTLDSTLHPWEWDKQRQLMGGFNAALGALGGQQITKGLQGGRGALKNFTGGLTALALTPAKDLMLKGTGSLNRMDSAMSAIEAAAKRPPSKSIADLVSKPVLMGLLGAGTVGGSIAAYGALQRARAAAAQAEAARGGRVRVTLPTKDPNDAETLLDMPLDDIKLSEALRSRLGRDTRRKLYEETRARTRRRKAQDPSNPTAREIEDAKLNDEEAALDKAAATAQAAVPSPPGPGNPALRMTQQSASANSIDTSTAANPQIMKAQQDAAAAGMDAQQQVAAAEQKTSQQLMDQQRGFQDQLAKADQEKATVVNENHTLKMQIEKTKVEADLAKARAAAKEEFGKLKSDAATAGAAGQNDQINAMIQSRIDRVRRRVSKSAAAVIDTARNPTKPWEVDPITGLKPQGHQLDPITGAPSIPALRPIRADAAQGLNTNGLEYMAAGGSPGIGVHRASYGALGDWLYSNFGKQLLLAPQPKMPTVGPDAGPESLTSMLGRYAGGIMHQPQFA